MSRAEGNLIIFSRILNGSLPRRLAIAAFVATYALPQSGEAAAKVVPWMDAQRLLSECSSPSGSSGDKTCEDYIEGIKDILSYLREDHVATSIEFPCLPHATTAGALKAVILNFLQRNPQYSHMEAAAVVYAGLMSAFPCQ